MVIDTSFFPSLAISMNMAGRVRGDEGSSYSFAIALQMVDFYFIIIRLSCSTFEVTLALSSISDSPLPFVRSRPRPAYSAGR